MELNRYANNVWISVPSGTEVVFCTTSSDNAASNENTNTSVVEVETNGFGLVIFKKTYRRTKQIHFNRLSSGWLLLNPSEELKMSRNNQIPARISLGKDTVTVAFGSLISPYQFKCAESRFFHQTHQYSTRSLFFAKCNSFISININDSQFKLKREHIDNHRGVVIDVKSTCDFIVYVCLRGNVDEYTLQNQANEHKRRFYLQDARGEQWQPCFSIMRLSICNKYNNASSVYQCLRYLIQFFSHHSIPIHFGTIEFTHGDFIYRNNLFIPRSTFICQYARQMLNSVSCRVYDQMVNNNEMRWSILRLLSQNDPDRLYYILERLRRLAISSENYFLNLLKELPGILNHYDEFYLDSAFYKMDKTWSNYVRIPWFCFTPTRLIIKPFKFMRSNRVFRFIPNVSQSMAFVEFRDDTGSAFLSEELVPFLQHYLENGFRFGGRTYIYLHHAQSQIRNKQFYFYCEEEGGMTREELEAWMGNFDDERLPAKNTARRTQPFSSTENTIEIDQQLVKIIPDVKTADEKYNFTDGVGQISSELNLSIHQAIGIYVDEGGYISSVLQIRYGGCKGTIAVNPRLDGREKQLLIRPSMNKFKCKHQMLELCKRSLRRRLCLNREVINLLSYREISSECLLVFQLRNILWLIASLVSNRSAMSVLREKVLHILPWSEIAYHPQLLKEPFFRRLLHTTISNNLHQLVTRAHIRVPEARYMFGIVDEYKVLKQGQVFIQITNEDGTKTVLEGSIAITKNPCRHPGDLLVLEAVDNVVLRHLYDVLVFPQQGSRPHASEISGSDLDGDEYTVIWDPKLVPTTSNPPPYDYDSGPAPKPLNRSVTRHDRLKVILDICKQDNLGRLSNIHLILVDKFGIDSNEAITLAGGLSQELDSVKSGQHPYTSEEIRGIISTAGRTRPDFMQTPDYEGYQSDKILGKLFRSAHHLTNAFSIKTDAVLLDTTLLHDGYKEYIDFARDLYKQYKNEMLEIIGSYGFSNEIDLFCCVESCNMKANERSDIQHTVQELLKAVFRDIRNRFHEDTMSFHQAKAKAAACYYVAYTDESGKNKCMLSFPWLFTSQLLSDYSINSEDEEENDFINSTLDSDSDIYQWLELQAPSLLNLLSNEDHFTLMELFEICFQKACDNNDERMINHIEVVLEQLIEIAKNTYSN